MTEDDLVFLSSLNLGCRQARRRRFAFCLLSCLEGSVSSSRDEFFLMEFVSLPFLPLLLSFFGETRGNSTNYFE